MSPQSEPPTSVGQQLKDRREALDLTQEALAQSIGITSRSVSATERDETEIRRSKRPIWEKALRLKAGTISRAYRDGSPIETLDSAPEAPPYPDPSNPKEVAAWAMDLSESDRRELIDMARELAARKRREQSA